MKGISVVIPTLHRSEFLQNTIKDLLIQDFVHPYEIIIVDQSTNFDCTIHDYARQYDNIKYYHITDFRGLPEARNFGWQCATYEYILYIDDDIQCDQTLLSEHFKYLQKEDIGVVAGGITEVHKENTDVKVGKFIKQNATPLRGFHKKGCFEVDHAGGGNFSTKKEILRQVRGVDENLTKGAALYEETDFCLRVKKMGYKILFNSQAHLYHLAAATGGCRVEEIEKYLYSLVRNRSLIIERHIKGFNKMSSELYLLKLVLAYVWAYKKKSLLNIYHAARKEGKIAGKTSVKCTTYRDE
ncbi:glycosyltransferase family 2 protein [Capnocytophaga canis]|uniref:glycosyltransferase family 2 protein n=1 Tax=Capnocytophaga canis TaxID=1848903 RepID=UPI0037D7C533